MNANRPRIIMLNKAEVQSGFDRQKAAEGLIQQLPLFHNGRDTWLLNYGVSDEAQTMRRNRGIEWVEKYRAAQTTAGEGEV